MVTVYAQLYCCLLQCTRHELHVAQVAIVRFQGMMYTAEHIKTCLWKLLGIMWSKLFTQSTRQDQSSFYHWDPDSLFCASVSFIMMTIQ